MFDLQPIGIVRSPFLEPAGTPIQPAFATDATGEVIVDEAYEEGLADLDGFDRIWLLTWCDRARPFRLKVVPYRDTTERGLFATRAPSRPNPIAISVVRLLSRSGRLLQVGGLDLLDGTPLLDLKPYVPAFDAFPDSAAGWFDRSSSRTTRADDRFQRGPSRL